jgi:hypothetical protein
MLDTDELIRAELELAYPAPAGAPDWGEVRGRLPRRRRRPGRLAAGGLALAAAAAVTLALGAPWRAGPSFADRAAAAIGSKRYVVAVVEPAVTYGAVVDLATGKARRERERTVYVVDSGSTDTIPALSSWTTIDGVTVGSSGGGNLSAEPGLATLVGGYRKALANGTAKVVGESAYRGRRVKIVRFTFDYATVVAAGFASQEHLRGGATEDVAVDAKTYLPVWVERTETELRGGRAVRVREPRDLIVSITSTDRPPAQPVAAATGIVLSRAAIGSVTRATAPLALGPRALWPGPSVAGLGFRSVRLEQLWSIAAGGAPSAPAPALRLMYADARGETVEVSESATLPPYGTSPAKLRAPPGSVRIDCYGCDVGNLGQPLTWRGQLRQGGLYVGIAAPTRELVLAAAEALRPMR